MEYMFLLVAFGCGLVIGLHGINLTEDGRKWKRRVQEAYELGCEDGRAYEQRNQPLD